MDKMVNRGSIATIHLLFNLITGLILLPFSDKVTEFTEKVIPDKEESSIDEEFSKLDDMLLNTPTIALEQCKALIYKMGEAILENYKLATDMIYQYSDELLPKMEENESFIDKCETNLSAYIVRIDRKRLTNDDKLTVYEILNSIGDFERMGDYCMNIAYVAKEKNEKEIHFSPSGHKETETIISAVRYTIETAIKSFMNDDIKLAVRVEPLSEAIDELKEIIKSHHVERLQEGICSIEGGVSLFDLVNSFERIASHAANVSLHVIKKVRRDDEFDEMHGHANDNQAEEYKAMYHYYESQYIEPILVHEGDKSYEAAIKSIDKTLEKKEKEDKAIAKDSSGKKNQSKDSKNSKKDNDWKNKGTPKISDKKDKRGNDKPSDKKDKGNQKPTDKNEKNAQKASDKNAQKDNKNKQQNKKKGSK